MALLGGSSSAGSVAGVDDWRTDRVAAALEGRNPTVLRELDSAFAVIGDVQFLPGYCLALSKVRGADRLSDLPRTERLAYLADVDLLATAVENVCEAREAGYRRVNVEILGNTAAFLHTHIWPRYDWEPDEVRGLPVWAYPSTRWSSSDFALGAKHDSLRAALVTELGRLA